MSTILNKILQHGWVEIENISTEKTLTELASVVGNILVHPNGENIATLNPSQGQKSIKGTFSNTFGLQKFPLHTDTAFWSTPTRFVMLCSFKPSLCNTEIIHIDEIWQNLNSDDKSHAKKAVYMIKTIHGQHYSSVLFQNNGVEGFKYDPCSMFPINNSAKIFDKKLKSILNELKPMEINWTGNKVLIFDNWKTLHGRGEAKIENYREIKRIYLN